jgi:DNA-directed RNA polymerase specialized sigma subunit
MTAKQYMNRVRRVDQEIQMLERMIQKTRDSVESITQKYDGDGAQATKNPHKFDRLVELEGLVDQKIQEQLTLKAETLLTIGKLKDRRQRMVLTEYYLEMKTWEQVAVDIGYSYQHVMRLHGYALKAVSEIM